MRIGKVIGTVTLSQSVAEMHGARMRLVVPQTLDNLTGKSNDEVDETLAVWDDLGAGIGSIIAFSESAEAAQPFKPDMKPIDAYNAAILDDLRIPK